MRKYFPEIKFEQDRGVASYLSNKIDNLDLLIKNSQIDSNLDLLISGAIPPNPIALLSSDRFENMINYFREKYDYIICDSTPCFAVSDSSLINKQMDHTLYLIRADYTDLRSLSDIEKLNKEKKMKDINLIFNSMDMDSPKYRYGFGCGYGYGYGYGSSYGCDYSYGDEKMEKKKWFTVVLKKIISKKKS